MEAPVSVASHRSSAAAQSRRDDGGGELPGRLPGGSDRVPAQLGRAGVGPPVWASRPAASCWSWATSVPLHDPRSASSWPATDGQRRRGDTARRVPGGSRVGSRASAGVTQATSPPHARAT